MSRVYPMRRAAHVPQSAKRLAIVQVSEECRLRLHELVTYLGTVRAARERLGLAPGAFDAALYRGHLKPATVSRVEEVITRVCDDLAVPIALPLPSSSYATRVLPLAMRPFVEITACGGSALLYLHDTDRPLTSTARPFALHAGETLPIHAPAPLCVLHARATHEGVRLIIKRVLWDAELARMQGSR